MKPLRILFLSVIITTFGNCIEDDFLNDEVEERISINNPINEIQINDTYQIDATFFNNVGQAEAANLTWNSSNTSVISISNDGLITAISEGTSTIGISTSINGKTIKEDKDITVVSSMVDNNQLVVKSGTIVTTSSYLLRGDFTLSEIENSQDLNLQVMGNYAASTSLPGLYIYLTNNPSSINGTLEIGAVTTFSGAHSYNIPNTGINDYKYILYWCKPFSVKVGEAEIND